MRPHDASRSPDRRSSLLVAIDHSRVFVKVVGRATCDSSKSLKDLASELRQLGYREYVLDLSDCLIMDSTFLGVVAGFGVNVAKAADLDHGKRVNLLNPNQRIRDLLDNLGVSQFFAITSSAAKPSVPDYQPAPTTAPATKVEIAQTSLEAHQFLMDINPGNVSKFKDVVHFLAEDLARLKKENKPPGNESPAPGS